MRVMQHLGKWVRGMGGCFHKQQSWPDLKITVLIAGDKVIGGWY